MTIDEIQVAVCCDGNTLKFMKTMSIGKTGVHSMVAYCVKAGREAQAGPVQQPAQPSSQPGSAPLAQLSNHPSPAQ